MKSEPTGASLQGSIFQHLAAIFKRHDVRCLLVGGYAVIASKIQRMTFDIDFMITPVDFTRIEPDILQLGYSAYGRQDAFVQLKCDKPGFRDIDFLLCEPSTVEGLLKEGRAISIAGESFTIPSPVHLVAMKLHSMAGNEERETKDLPDVVQLMALHDMDPRRDEIKTLFKKYNAMHLFDRIARALDVKNEKRG